MNIEVKYIGGRLVEVEVESRAHGALINTGTLDRDEALDIARQLAQVASELVEFAQS